MTQSLKQIINQIVLSLTLLGLGFIPRISLAVRINLDPVPTTCNYSDRKSQVSLLTTKFTVFGSDFKHAVSVAGSSTLLRAVTCTVNVAIGVGVNGIGATSIDTTTVTLV